MNNINTEKFKACLAQAYTELFKTPKYAYAAARSTPQILADKMTDAFIRKTGSNKGDGIKAACKAWGIKTTYKSIHEFLGV